MTILTIPKQLTNKGELIVLPRKEYEELLHFRSRIVKEVPMTLKQKRAFIRARKNLAQGNFLTIHELKQKLGIKG